MANSKSEEYRKALKKIERFETIGALDFSHLILPDYNVRLHGQG